MAINLKKCPLCSGTVSNGQCIDCGYRVPGEDELNNMSRLYDFDPEDYPKEEGLQSSPVEEHRPESGYKGYKDDTPRRIPRAVVHHNNNVYQPPAAPAAPPPSPHQNIQNNAPNPNNNPANAPRILRGTYSGGGKSKGLNISSDNIPWGPLILSLLIPIVGIVCGCSMLSKNNTPEQRFFGGICLALGILRFFSI